MDTDDKQPTGEGIRTSNIRRDKPGISSRLAARKRRPSPIAAGIALLALALFVVWMIL